jgi:chromosome segregation ATPase
MHFKMKSKLSTLLLIISIFVSSSLVAEVPNSKIGRLEDGRAYRTDSNGYQMIDQLAEMQVSVDTLKKQVIELQDELNAKNIQIQNLSEKPGTQLPQAIQKTDCSKLTAPLQSQIEQLNNDLKLLSEKQTDYENFDSQKQLTQLQSNLDSANSQIKNLQFQIKNKEAEVSKLAMENNSISAQLMRIENSTEAERNLTSSLQNEIEDLKAKLQTSRADVAKGNLEISKLRNETAKIKSSLNSTAQETETVKKDLDYKDTLISEQAKSIETLTQSVDSFKEAVANYESLLIEKEQKISMQASDLARTKMELSNLSSEITQRENARARLSNTQPVPSSSLPKANTPKPQQTKSITTLAPEIRAINDLIKERDQMYNSSAIRSKGIAIRLQPLVSKNGNSLESIRTKISSSDNTGNYGKELAEIKAILVDDINILKRLEKL